MAQQRGSGRPEPQATRRRGTTKRRRRANGQAEQPPGCCDTTRSSRPILPGSDHDPERVRRSVGRWSRRHGPGSASRFARRVLETCTKTRTGRFRWWVAASTRPVRRRGSEKVRSTPFEVVSNSMNFFRPVRSMPGPDGSCRFRPPRTPARPRHRLTCHHLLDQATERRARTRARPAWPWRRLAAGSGGGGSGPGPRSSSSAEITNSSGPSRSPANRRWYKSSTTPALAAKSAARGKIHERCRHGLRASSSSQRQTILTLSCSTSPQAMASSRTSATLMRLNGTAAICLFSPPCAAASTIRARSTSRGSALRRRRRASRGRGRLRPPGATQGPVPRTALAPRPEGRPQGRPVVIRPAAGHAGLVAKNR
jgi:hypothetical protein